MVDGNPRLSDAAFIIWSRDFLAGVAAPATADTIQLTEAYRERRADSFVTRTAKFLCVFTREGRNAFKTQKAQDKIIGSANKLAARVRTLNFLGFAMTVITLMLSIYALSGSLIVSARDDAIKTLKTIEDRIRDLESHQTDHIIANPQIYNHLLWLGTVGKILGLGDSAGGSAPLFSLCDNVGAIGLDPTDDYKHSPSFGPIPNGVVSAYASYDQIDVCQQRRRTMIQLFAIGEQLVSWQRVVTGSKAPGSIFGRSDEVSKEFSDNKLICAFFTGNRNPPHNSGNPDDLGQIEYIHERCQVSLSEIPEYYGKIPDSILGCISLYILPCLYGFLGSVAATMRYLRPRADSYLINFTDRGTILQNMILGVVAGAVIGLFAAYLLKTGPLQGIGVSGLAFLAGYNVSGLFALFDDISNRLFRSTASSSK